MPCSSNRQQGPEIRVILLGQNVAVPEWADGAGGSAALDSVRKLMSGGQLGLLLIFQYLKYVVRLEFHCWIEVGSERVVKKEGMEEEEEEEEGRISMYKFGYNSTNMEVRSWYF